MGASRLPHAAEPWTREQIEAWIRFEGEPQPPARWMRVAQAARRALVRLCPEAPDYDALIDKIDRLNPRSYEWMEVATDDDINAWAEETVAKLWSRSLSEPVEGEAP